MTKWYKVFKLLFFLNVIVFCNCNNFKNNTNFNVDLINTEERDFLLSEICDSILYIPLDNSLFIKHLNEVGFDKGIFFCSTYPEGILTFNIDGSYINRIGKIGHGPGEYINGVRFMINEKRNQIYVDSGTRDILKFDYMGNYRNKTTIKTKTMPYPSYIDYCDNYFICSYVIITSKVKNLFQWVVIDTLGNITYKKHNIDYEFSRSGPSFSGELTYKFNNKIHYWNHYNDTIFQIINNNYCAKYILYKGDKKLTPETVSKMIGFKNIENYIVLRKILESNNFLFINYDFQKRGHLVLLNKNSNKAYEISKNYENNFGIKNDFDCGPNFNPYGALDDKTIIMWITPFELKKHVSSYTFKNSTPKYSEKKNELERLANSLNENDNPVLMLVKLKN